MNHRFANPIVSGGQQYEDHFNIAVVPVFLRVVRRSSDRQAGCDPETAGDRSTGVPYANFNEDAGSAGARWRTPTHKATICRNPKRCAFIAGRVPSTANPLLRGPERGIGQHYSSNTSRPRCCSAPCSTPWTPGRHGKLPPDSRIPTRADNTLVDYATWRRQQFPAIPGVMALRRPKRGAAAGFRAGGR